ncbi:MAG: c-type cytochrome [Rhodocyclaceae bacterium]|nr:c-type cytochrome [Rhodocyclaceae bacterium]
MNKTLTTIILVAVASLAPLAASAQTPVWNDIKGEEKIALETKGDVGRGAVGFEACQGCHRKDASGRVSGAYPRLSGQHATVVIKQIADIRAGRRINPKMEPYSDDHALTPYQIADIAAYLQSLPISADNGKGPGTAGAAGKQLYDKDCATCHGDAGEGNAAKFYPMVAAQHYHYLLRELFYIRDARRANANPMMVKVIKSYGDADLEALADYMAQLPPPRK